jgi:hypothetical protein
MLDEENNLPVEENNTTPQNSEIVATKKTPNKLEPETTTSSDDAMEEIKEGKLEDIRKLIVLETRREVGTSLVKR